MKGIIFDMDGTLLDSMGVWDVLSIHYLEGLGKVPENDLVERLKPYSLKNAGKYLIDHYDLQMSEEEIQKAFAQQLLKEYETVTYKEGVVKFLETCKKKQFKLAVLTANHLDLTVHTLKQLGIDIYFDEIISCETIDLSKQEVESYQYALKQLGCLPEECIVIEDAYHALKTAKQAGCHVWAMYDPSNECDWPNIIEIADNAFTSYQKMEEIICTQY